MYACIHIYIYIYIYSLLSRVCRLGRRTKTNGGLVKGGGIGYINTSMIIIVMIVIVIEIVIMMILLVSL